MIWEDTTSLAPEINVAPPGPRSRALADRISRVENPAFDARRDTREKTSGADQAPIVYASSSGVNVTCVDGNRYVDLVCGFGACIFGHAPSFIVRAVESAQRNLWLALGDVYGSEAKAIALEKIAALFPEKNARVMLGLSGADAVTAALKTCVLATGKPGVVAFEGAYHGLSYAPLAACGLAPGFRAPFEAQLGDHVSFAHYPDGAVADVTRELERALYTAEKAVKTSNAGAVIVEPILGRGGCVVPPPGFLHGLREICDRHGALLIADEIWTGLGRSGAVLLSLSECTPDLVCIGKGLGAGVPISACIGRDEAMQAWGAHGGSAIHTATHFAVPSACAAASAVIDVVCTNHVADHARDLGAKFVAKLRAEIRHGASVVGRGMMVGIAMRDSAAALALTRRMLARGFIGLTGGKNGNVVTLTPALNTPEAILLNAADVISEELRSLGKKA